MTDPNQVGKRYTCAECGTQVICVKRGDGRFSCHGQPMELQSAKPLPSSDSVTATLPAIHAAVHSTPTVSRRYGFCQASFA